MLVYHDEDVEVHVNGRLIFREGGHVTAYHAIEVTEEMRRSFRRGRNTVAVHCRQTAGGQYIDVGFIEGIVPDAVTADGKAKGRDLLLDGPAD
jgi:hypothetical protein